MATENAINLRYDVINLFRFRVFYVYNISFLVYHKMLTSTQILYTSFMKICSMLIKNMFKSIFIQVCGIFSELCTSIFYLVFIEIPFSLNITSSVTYLGCKLNNSVRQVLFYTDLVKACEMVMWSPSQTGGFPPDIPVSSHTKTIQTQTSVPTSMINISCITCFVIVVK